MPEYSPQQVDYAKYRLERSQEDLQCAEKLFDNFLAEDISAVLSDKTINIFPHRKKFKSTFFVAKINIRDSHPSIIYVKRFQGFF